MNWPPTGVKENKRDLLINRPPTGVEDNERRLRTYKLVS